MVRHVLYAARGHENTWVTAVVSDSAVAEICRQSDISVLWNHHPEKGQSCSVALATAELTHCAGLLFLPADMPFLTRETVSALLRTFREDPEQIIAGFDGKRYHPALFPQEFFSQLMELSGDTGGRGIIAAHRDRVRTVPVSSLELTDIDRRCDVPGENRET